MVDRTCHGTALFNVLAAQRVGKLLSPISQWHWSGWRSLARGRWATPLWQFQSLAVLLDPAAPFAELEDSDLHSQGLSVISFARGSVVEGRGIALAFTIKETNCTLSWSNPLWDHLEYGIVTESSRILQLASSVAQGLPPSQHDSLALVQPGPIFEFPNAGSRSPNVAALVLSAAIASACLACALFPEAVQEQAACVCWARCRDTSGFAVKESDLALDLPTQVEQYVLVEGNGSGAMSPNQEACTPGRGREGGR